MPRVFCWLKAEENSKDRSRCQFHVYSLNITDTLGCSTLRLQLICLRSWDYGVATSTYRVCLRLFWCHSFTFIKSFHVERLMPMLSIKWPTIKQHNHFSYDASFCFKVFVTWFAPVLVFIYFHFNRYLHHPAPLREKLLRPFNVDKTFPSRWRIIDNRNILLIKYSSCSILHNTWSKRVSPKSVTTCYWFKTFSLHLNVCRSYVKKKQVLVAYIHDWCYIRSNEHVINPK